MRKLISIILLIFSALVTFNLCFFICVDYKGNEQAWACYLFFHLAYLLSMLGFLFTTRRRFAVLNSRLHAVSFFYLILTAVTCLMFLSVFNFSKELEIFVFLMELLFYLMIFHYCYITNRKAEKGIVKDLKNTSKHENWITNLRLLTKTIDDKEKKNVINSIIDEIRSSPSMSNSSVYNIDNEIQSVIRILKAKCTDMQLEELVNYKNQINIAVRKRTELLKSSYYKK